VEVRLGKYQLVDKLGAGPLGEVFRARDTPLGRPVVLKAYRTRAEPGGRFAPRFLQTAKAAVGLDHENVVPVIDCGIEEGRPFVTRELQEGRLLKDVLADRAPLSWLKSSASFSAQPRRSNSRMSMARSTAT
jgi:serine/threonine-protein kinase